MKATDAQIIVTHRDRDRLLQVVDVFTALQYDVLVEFLRHELLRANVVAPDEVPRSIATMNSRVRYRENETGTILTSTLVYPGEEDSWLGRVSILTPTGTALIGLSEGQTISWRDQPGRMRSLTLLDVLFQPEAAGRFDL
jgi:regulator of nucleoside diphosphate kinase